MTIKIVVADQCLWGCSRGIQEEFEENTLACVLGRSEGEAALMVFSLLRLKPSLSLPCRKTCQFSDLSSCQGELLGEFHIE